MATQIQYWWDDQDPQNAGWYAREMQDGEFRDDSMKVWFPVEVDEYDQDQSEDLAAALAEAFPDAEIVAR